jgi:hypothetical protein
VLVNPIEADITLLHHIEIVIIDIIEEYMATTMNPTDGSSGSPTTLYEKKPVITVGTSTDYQHRLADITSRAIVKEPFYELFQNERLGALSPTSAGTHYQNNLIRIRRKMELGCVIVEAGNWAAAACWKPPGSDPGPIPNEMLRNRPVFADYVRKYEAAKSRVLGSFVESGQYWHLSLMARDPETHTKGAVRAVIEPYLRKAVEDGVPILIEACSPRARDVYSYFGFVIVEEFWIGETKYGSDGYEEEGGPGVPSWFMVFNAPDQFVMTELQDALVSKL